MTLEPERATETLIRQAKDALSVRDYKRCHALCIEAIKRNPRGGEPYLLLSILTSDHNNIAKALEIIERGIGFDGARPSYLAQRAKCLTLLNRHDEAAKDAGRALEQDPDDVFTLDALGVIFSRVGEHAKAAPLFAKACESDPENDELQYNLASSLQFSGRFDAAERAYRRAIDLNPKHSRAYYGLTSLKKQSVSGELLETMKTLFDACKAPDDRLHLGHAIAKTLEDTGEHRAAMGYLIEAKVAKRKALNYGFEQDAALFDAAEALSVDGIAGAAGDDQGPVFVVGMPRTGTTLVDRILSSHSTITSVGELTHFGLLLKQVTTTPSPMVLDAQTLSRAERIDIGAVGAGYLQQTERLRGGARRFVDKMPLNFFYAPLILKAIPGARVICLKRHPLDACVSNFRQLFRTSYSYYNYAYSLEDTGRYYARFHALTEMWAKTLPPSRFTCVQYEDIVFSQEETTRRLLDFCGAPFEDACLSFHENDAPVATASSVQVRKPLYSSSIGRWKEYGDDIRPLVSVLEKAGLAPDPA